MAFLRTFLFAVLFALVAADDSCPAATEISPCTCDGEGLNCIAAQTLNEIRKAFRAKFKYGGVRAVWVQGTPITDIPGDLFGNVKSQQFYVEVNDVSSVNFNAFSASKKTMVTLSLFGNKLEKLNSSGLEQYEVLNMLNLGRNLITSIPDRAFNSKSISSIILKQNQIYSIGKNAFSGVTNLQKLDLSFNQLQTLGPMSLASNAHSASLQIILSANKISSVSSTAFQGTSPYGLYFTQNKLTSLPYDIFGKLITRIAQKGGFIDVSANSFSCRGCDYSWLVTNKDILQTRFIGFKCQDGRSMQQLTKDSIQCRN